MQSTVTNGNFYISNNKYMDGYQTSKTFLKQKSNFTLVSPKLLKSLLWNENMALNYQLVWPPYIQGVTTKNIRF